jgi:hypothetical protein
MCKIKNMEYNNNITKRTRRQIMNNEPFDMDFFLELLYVVAGTYLQTGFLIGSGSKPNNDNIEALNNLINYVKSTINPTINTKEN